MKKQVVETFYRLRDGTTEVLRRIRNQFRTNADTAEATSKRVEIANRRQQTSFSGLLGKIGRVRFAYFAVAAAVTSVLASFRSFAKAASDQENAERRLAVALRNGAGATEEQLQALRDLAQERQRQTRFSDEQTISAQAQLATFQLTAEQIATLTPRVQDLAEGTRRLGRENVDLEQSAILVGKAITGNAGDLSRYGVVLTDAQRETIRLGDAGERVAALAEALDANFRGLATSLTPFELAVQSAGNGFGDFQEKLGAAITNSPAVISAINSIRETFENVGNALSERSEGIERVLSGLVASFSGFAAAVSVAFNTALGAANRFAAAVLNVGASVAEGLAKIPFNRLKDEFRDFAEQARAEAAELEEKSVANFTRVRDSALDYVEAGKNVIDSIRGQVEAAQEQREEIAQQTQAEKDRRAALERTAEALKQFGVDVQKVETGVSMAARESIAALTQLAVDGEASLSVLAAAAQNVTEKFDDAELVAFDQALIRLRDTGQISQAQFEALGRSTQAVAGEADRAAGAFNRISDAIPQAGSFAQIGALAAQIKALGDQGQLSAEQIEALLAALEAKREELERTANELNVTRRGLQGVGSDIQQEVVDPVDAARLAFNKALRQVGAWIDEVKNFSTGAGEAVDSLIEKLNSVGGAPITEGFRPLYRGLQDITLEFERQTALSEELIEGYRKSGDAALFLREATRLVREDITLLDDTRLDALTSVIGEVRAEMQAVRDDSAALVQGLEDDLLRLQGKTEEIEERRRQRRRDEIELQLRSNDIDLETRKNLKQALRLMDEIETTRRAQAEQEDQIANAAERQADAAERTRDSMGDLKVTKSGAIEVNLRTLGGETGAPRFSQSDMANLANHITPLILQRIREDQSRGL